jgi:NitT/TauT family transport system substrate-binding protein
MVTVKMAQLDPPPVGSAPLLIAQDKGYFADQGINVELVPFANSSDIAAALAANQVDAGVLGVNVGLFNAFDCGIKVVLAADAGSSRPGFDYTAIVVRKALLDSGRFKSAVDFRGLKVSIPSSGTPADYGFAQLLQPVGLTLADVDLQTMGFPSSSRPIRMLRVDFWPVG